MEKEKTNNSNGVAIFLAATVISLSILLSSFSNFDLPFDGILRNNQGDPTLGVYEDYPTETHSQSALFNGRSYLISGNNTLNVGASDYFLGCTQDKAVHFDSFVVSFSATPFDVHFYEDPVITNNGTQIYSKNLERNFRNTNSSLITYYNPTFSNSGTLIFYTAAYGGNNLVGDVNIPSEIILKTNTCYLFEITNNDGNNVDVTYNMIWHESEYNYSYYFP